MTRQGSTSTMKAVAALVIAVAAMAALWASAAAASPTSVKSLPGADSASEAKEIKEYWTSRRMRNATPLDVTVTRRDVAQGARATAANDGRGEVISVPPSNGAGEITGEVKVPMATIISNPSVYPFRTQGKVFFNQGGGSYVCSATTVNSATKRVIFTAGHCLVDERQASYNVAFVPGYKNGARPYGTFVATKLYSINGWINNRDFSYDIAAAVIGGSRKVGQVVGTRGIKFNLPRQQNFVSFGYPAASPFNGQQLYKCPSPYKGQDRSGNPRPQWITCNMTGGSSGGGWIVQNAYLNSVNSYGYDSQPNRMYGPYFGSAAAGLYNAVKNLAP
jgi:V8-like Glu-specific endopeptidase